MKTLLATFLISAAVALPVSAAQARDNVSIRIDTPEFGFRIGTPHYGPVYGPPVVVAPAPVYVPPHVVHRPYGNYGGVRYLPYGHYKRWDNDRRHRRWDRHDHRWDRHDRRWDRHDRHDRDHGRGHGRHDGRGGRH